MKTIAVYHKTIPSAKNKEKADLLINFATGVKLTGDTVYNQNSYEIRQADVAVIQGWVNMGSKSGPHLDLRNRVVSELLSNSKHVVAVDSNLFLYANTSNPMHYLRYSFNGVFPNTGNYCDSDIDPKRWSKISNNLGIKLKNWRTTGNHILLCLQRNGGWSMGDFDVQDWTIEIISELKKYTDRPIIIRPHPGTRQAYSRSASRSRIAERHCTDPNSNGNRSRLPATQLCVREGVIIIRALGAFHVQCMLSLQD
jgi:hypothetical protein